LNLHEFSRGQFVLSGLDYQMTFASPRRWRSLRALIAASAIGAVVLLAGCNDINPYLGAAATQSSTIGYITPSSRPAGCSGFTLDIIGAGFVNDSVVTWNNSPRATNFESASELLATINASDIATQTPVSIVVSSPVLTGPQNQGNNLSNFVTFTIAPSVVSGTCAAPPNFLPSITALSQPSGTVGTSLEIAGNYFGGQQNSSTVTFNGVAATPTGWTGTLITVPVPPVPVPAGAASVTTAVLVTVGGVQSAVPNPGSNNFIVLASSTTSRSPAASASATRAVIAADSARYAAFVAVSADPSAATGPGVPKVYLRDTCIGVPTACSPTTIPISVGFDGTDPNGGSSSPSVSASGRFVAFASDANNLVPGDANGASDIFVRDTCIGAAAGCAPSTARVSLGPDGIESNGASASPKITMDGRLVVFHSVATNLASADPADQAASSEGRFLWDSCFGAANGCKPSLTRLRFLPPSSR
jgi:hypothetical protein